MKTIGAKINIGICEGYFHENKTEETNSFEELVKFFSLKVYNETGIYVSFVSYKTKTLYNADWGCPIGGEDTYNLETVANPQFVTNICLWKQSLLQIVRLLKRELKQSTVTVQFIEQDVLYITDDNEEVETILGYALS
jgi:hypothetical protein